MYIIYRMKWKRKFCHSKIRKFDIYDSFFFLYQICLRKIKHFLFCVCGLQTNLVKMQTYIVCFVNFLIKK